MVNSYLTMCLLDQSSKNQTKRLIDQNSECLRTFTKPEYCPSSASRRRSAEGDRPKAISGAAADRRRVARGAWPEEINRRQLGAGDRPEVRHDRQEEIGNRRPSSPRHAARGDPHRQESGLQAVLPCCSGGSSPSDGSRPSLPLSCRSRPAGHCHHVVLFEGILASRGQQAVLAVLLRIRWSSSPRNTALGVLA